MDFNPDVLQKLINNDLDRFLIRRAYDGVNSPLDVAKTSSLRKSLMKKWIPKVTTHLDSIAYEKFFLCNDECADFIIDPDDLYLNEVIDEARNMLYQQFHRGPFQTTDFSLPVILGMGEPGPGASVGTKSKDFFHKMFFGPMASTSDALYTDYVCGISPRWKEAELRRSFLFETSVVMGSKLSTVPKNAETNRTICVEPSLNMFFQRGAGVYIERMLKRDHNIDLATQPDYNKTLARVGSLNGAFGTIDLTSASDTIAMLLVKLLYPHNVFNVLQKIRSPYTRVGGEWHELHMIGSMGNGFTFPLQTQIFATLVRAVYKLEGITPLAGRYCNYGVFGDDIIVLERAYNKVVKVLNGCGFSVNSEKSYNEGPFRESCGGDYFEGHDIRGVYLKEIRHEQDVYSAFNRLSRWSAKHSIDLSSGLHYLKGLVEFRPVPYDSGDTEGIKCPSSHLPTNSVKTDRNGSTIYRATIPKPAKLKIGPAKLDYNFHAGIISSVGGYVRERCIGLRVDKPVYRVVVKRTPCWDYVTDAGLTIRDYQLVWSNLS